VALRERERMCAAFMRQGRVSSRERERERELQRERREGPGGCMQKGTGELELTVLVDVGPGKVSMYS
jgi:hypothetical protein